MAWTDNKPEGSPNPLATTSRLRISTKTVRENTPARASGGREIPREAASRSEARLRPPARWRHAYELRSICRRDGESGVLRHPFLLGHPEMASVMGGE